MRKLLPKFKLLPMLSDEAEMRAFLECAGIRKRTIEAAIKMRRNRPVKNKEPPLNGKKRKAVATC
jgi:hypothetical protein